MDIIEGARIPKDEVDSIERKLANDLIALFRVMRDDAVRLLAKADDEGWTEDRVMDEMAKLWEGGGDGI
jgi:hypothetical protein